MQPLAREDRGDDFHAVAWPQATARLAAAIRKAQAEGGPDAVMLYGSGQLLTEDYYLFGKLAKGFLRTNNQDTNSRLCMASAVAAYTLALGADSPPCSYADIEAAKTFLIVGANPEACHPILFNRIKARRRADKSVRVIVIDPRRTRTAEIADIHLRPRPGSDVALLNALLYEVLLAGGVDHAFIDDHTAGWADLSRVLGRYQAELAHESTGVPAQDIVRRGPRVRPQRSGPFAVGDGAQPEHTRRRQEPGVDQPGAGDGQHRQGGRRPLLADRPAQRDGRARSGGGSRGGCRGTARVADAGHRAEIEAAWGVTPGSISARPGLTAIEMVEALEDGRVKVLWVAGTNPLASLPNTERVRAALAKADFVAVQDRLPPDGDDGGRRPAAAGRPVVGAGRPR